MTTPTFSIVIPTRDRAVTFRHTLATVASQLGDDYEIVVADNASGPAIRFSVEELAPGKTRYVRSETILSMTANWENGLAACRGEYVTVLGDDDAFLPSSLALARKLIAATKAKIITWQWHTYWWPDTIAYWQRNRLYVSFASEAVWKESRQVLEQYYKGLVSFYMLPMIYNSFVHRSLLDHARQRYGAFFPIAHCPDIVSGILNASIVDRFVFTGRPLSIGGVSGKSYGTAHWARSLGAQQRAEFLRFENAGLTDIGHESLIPSPNSHIAIAGVKMRCKELFFPQDQTLSVDVKDVIATILHSLNSEPEAYEENLADAKLLAQKHNIVIDPGRIPPPVAAARRLFSGPIAGSDGKIAAVGINCDLLGISDIAAASRLAEALLPPLE
jgi:glycosyltransferase involved in cell wall biosynthesis